MTLAVGCLVIAGPSGVGKSSMIGGAMERNPGWIFSISATTRPIREGEVDGREYHFFDEDKFQRWATAGRFLEYARVYGNFYGTPASELDRAAGLGKNLLIEVDTVGCLSIRALRPEIPLVAILPPSIAELKRRLKDRGTEGEESLGLRYANIIAELQRMRTFDFAIVNDDLEKAQKQLLDLMTISEQKQIFAQAKVDRLLHELEVMTDEED